MRELFDRMTRNLDTLGVNAIQEVYVSKDVNNSIAAESIVYQGYVFDIKEKRDVVMELFKLPNYVEFEGVQFAFKLFINHIDDMRLVYEIGYISESSPHYPLSKECGSWLNPFIREDDTHLCSFLFLEEHIENEEQLFEAIDRCLEFLTKNKLI